MYYFKHMFISSLLFLEIFTSSLQSASPVVTSSELTSVSQDSVYMYTLVASDVDGDTLSWSVTPGTSLPSWLTLNQPSWVQIGTAGFSAGQVSYVSIALDNNNTPYVAYTDFENSKKASVMKFNGYGWLQVGSAGFSEGEVSYTSIALDPIYNLPYVVYRDAENSNKNSVMKYDGSAWVTVGSTFGSGSVSYNSMKFSYGNYLSVTYTEANSGHPLEYGIPALAPSTWDQIPTSWFTAYTYNYTYIVYDNNNIPYGVRDNTHGAELSVIKYNGSSWEQVGSAGFSAGEAYYTSIAFDGNNTPYVVYRDGEYSSKASVMKFDGSSWVQVGSAGISADLVGYTSIAFDSNNTPYVLYEDYLNGRKATVMKYSSNFILSGTPSNADVGTYDINLTVSDGNGGVSTQNFTITVDNVDDKPTLTAISNVIATEDASDFNITLEGEDIDGDTITYTAISSNTDIATVAIVNEKLVITPVADATGVLNIEVNATANGQTATQTFSLELTPINDKPTLATISDIIVFKDSDDKNITLEAYDVEGDMLSYSVEVADESLFRSITFENNVMKMILVPNVSGNSDMNVTVSDGDLNSSKVFNFTILPLDDGEDVERIGDITQTSDANTTTTTIHINNHLALEIKKDFNGTVSSIIVVDTNKIKTFSDINGSNVAFTSNGVTTFYSDVNVTVETNTSIDGKTSSQLKDINGIITSVISEFFGAFTKITNDLNDMVVVETSVDVDENTSVTLRVKENGSIENLVIFDGIISSIISNIAGAFTKITTNLTVETEAGDTPSDEVGYTIKAKVLTDEYGKTITSFIKVNDNDPSDETVVSSTLKPTSTFAAGNSVEIKEMDDTLYMKIRTSLGDENLEIE